MKKKVRQYANQIQGGALDRRHVLKDFSHMLDNQVLCLLYQRHYVGDTNQILHGFSLTVF